MTGRATSFEVQVLQEKRWVLTEVVEDEATAIQFADSLLNKSSYEAVRVVRDFKRIDGLHSETVVHEKASSGQKIDISLTPVAEAPVCTELGDLYGLSSRMVMGRLFRRYLDEAVITPTELLHNARELKRLGDKDRLLMSAVDSIATLQAPGGGEEAKARREFLYKSWDQLFARARQAAPEKPPKEKTLKELSAAAAKAGGDKDFRCLVLMSARLLDQRAWLAKLDTVLGWVAEEDAPPWMEALDGLIADLLMPAQAIQDLLGFQQNLGAALCHICDLAEGTAQAAKFASDAFTAVNQLFSAGRLPQARGALVSRVTRELRSTNPLSRNEPEQEYETFVHILNRLVSHQGVLGGPAMADSMTQRYVRFHNMGGIPGMVNAVDEITGILGDGCRTVLYLTALVELPRATASFGPDLLRRLGELARGREHINAWVPLRLPPRDRMAALTQCHQAICGSAALPDRLKADLAGRADAVLASYLEDDQVIEKIDKPEDPLAFRALRLVKFCASGVLIAGKSLDMAHQRVLGHLRQPQFEEKFLASIPDASQAERHLREFHRLLMESGFKG